MRTFIVSAYGTEIDRVTFIGEEYNETTVKEFLMKNERMSRDIDVRLIREVQRP